MATALLLYILQTKLTKQKLHTSQKSITVDHFRTVKRSGTSVTPISQVHILYKLLLLTAGSKNNKNIKT